jgi:hypothetical protein
MSSLFVGGSTTTTTTGGLSSFDELLQWVKQGRVQANMINQGAAVINTVLGTALFGPTGPVATTKPTTSTTSSGTDKKDGKTREDWLEHHQNAREENCRKQTKDAFLVHFQCSTTNDLNFAWNQCELLRPPDNVVATTAGPHHLIVEPGERANLEDKSFFVVYTKELVLLTKQICEQFKHMGACSNLVRLHDHLSTLSTTK